MYSLGFSDPLNQDYGCLYTEASAKSGENVNEAMEILARYQKSQGLVFNKKLIYMYVFNINFIYINYFYYGRRLQDQEDWELHKALNERSLRLDGVAKKGKCCGGK